MDKKEFIKLEKNDWISLIKKVSDLENVNKKMGNPVVVETPIIPQSQYIFESNVLYPLDVNQLIRDQQKVVEFKKELEQLMLKYQMLKCDGIFIHKFN